MNMRGRLFDDGYGGATFPEPRPFQITAHEALREGARAGHRCQMIMAPTGAGKSYLGLRIAHEALLKGRRALFVCDRTTLINQTSETADSYGLSDHGIIQAQHWRRDKSMPFQIASVQTLARRNWPNADVIIIDEAHTQHAAWVEHAKNTKAAVIGLSATPFSRGLGRTFTNLINAATMHGLTESGVLVPMRVFSCTKPDMKGAETKAGGEWADRAAEERGMVIIGDVVSEWAKFASDRKTIVFGATIKHCEEIVRQFSEAGIMAAVFTSLTSDVERKSLLEEYRKPDSMIRVLVSVEALAKGFDVQDVGCVCDCRPLRKSLSTAIQMWGRGLRSSPGKKDCIAEGSLVLTDRGLVAIESVLLYDKVWDGYEFVAHKGVIHRGKKQVITYAGLTATPDHRVKTKEGWRTFGECAEKQTPIISTGIGRRPVRACENHFSGRCSSWSAARHAPACIGRLCDMWASVIHSIIKPHKRSIERLSILQQAETNPCLASSQMREYGSSVQKSERRTMGVVRRARNRVSLYWTNCLRALDSGKPRASSVRERHGNRQDQQQWALRARESSVGGAQAEYVKQDRMPMGTVDAQVHDYAPGNQIRRIYASLSDFIRNVILGNRREVSPSVLQTEREVWDILDCGPRNSFTCEGLLVHNCLLLDFSGNVIRFADDFSEIFYGGLDRLDDGEKLDKAIRNDDEKPSRKCPNCGFSPCGKRCISCGYEAQSPALVVAVPGKMKEIFIGGAKCAEDAAHLYAQACMYARTHSAPEKQAGRAANIYRSITGKWPPNTWRFESTVPAEVSRPVLNKIRSGNIAFSKGRGRHQQDVFASPTPTPPILSSPITGKYGSHRE